MDHRTLCDQRAAGGKRLLKITADGPYPTCGACQLVAEYLMNCAAELLDDFGPPVDTPRQAMDALSFGRWNDAGLVELLEADIDQRTYWSLDTTTKDEER